MRVEDLCQNEVVTVLADADLASAARLMQREGVGFLIVVEPRVAERALKVLGVLTDRDIVVSVVAREASPRSLTVGEVMTRKPLLVKGSSPLEAALSFMQEARVRRAPVLSDAGALVGILALDDVLKLMALQMNKIANCFCAEPKVEQRSRLSIVASPGCTSR